MPEKIKGYLTSSCPRMIRTKSLWWSRVWQSSTSKLRSYIFIQGQWVGGIGECHHRPEEQPNMVFWGKQMEWYGGMFLSMGARVGTERVQRVGTLWECTEGGHCVRKCGGWALRKAPLVNHCVTNYRRGWLKGSSEIIVLASLCTT